MYFIINITQLKKYEKTNHKNDLTCKGKMGVLLGLWIFTFEFLRFLFIFLFMFLLRDLLLLVWSREDFERPLGVFTLEKDFVFNAN